MSRDTVRDHVLQSLRAREAALRRSGVTGLYLFGSMARDTAGPDSDVDLFFDYADPRFSMIELIDVQTQITAILGRRADVMTRGSLHPMLRDAIEASAIQVF